MELSVPVARVLRFSARAFPRRVDWTESRNEDSSVNACSLSPSLRKVGSPIAARVYPCLRSAKSSVSIACADWTVPLVATVLTRPLPRHRGSRLASVGYNSQSFWSDERRTSVTVYFSVTPSLAVPSTPSRTNIPRPPVPPVPVPLAHDTIAPRELCPRSEWWISQVWHHNGFARRNTVPVYYPMTKVWCRVPLWWACPWARLPPSPDALPLY